MLWVAGGAPVTGTLVHLEPGNHFTRTDSTGYFRLAVPGGRYLLTVLYLGAARASDSITNSEAGVEVLVALARPDPDLLDCVRLAPPR